MFFKESEWIASWIKELGFSDIATVLDIGSSSELYRTQKQPHLGNLYEKIQTQLQCKILTLDVDPQSQADFLLDISDPNFPEIPSFDIVLVNNMLEHIYPDKMETVIGNIKRLTKKYLVVTSPLYYIWHFQPIDNGLRVTPEELTKLFGIDFKPIKMASWEDEHYNEKYSMTSKPWVSGVILQKVS